MPSAHGAEAAQAVHLTPAPADLVTTNGHFRLTSGIAIATPAGDIEAYGVAKQFQSLLIQTTGVRLKLVNPPQTPAAIRFRRGDIESSALEAYRLDIIPEGITITAPHREGLFYGAMTLWQLAQQNSTLPALTIKDQPRYGWRGLMLDSARHYQSPSDIRLLIDAMAVHKLNVLHWHLTDDQAWRLEIKRYPKLTEASAFRQLAGAQGFDARGALLRYGGFYTQDDVRELIAYARARNITIVPEIEMPGHALAAVHAYPEFGVTGQPPNESMNKWGVYPYLFNIDDATFRFLTDVLDEVMDLFPSDYIHIGGDEAIKNQWRASPYIQQRIKDLGLKDEDELQSWFITRIGQHIAKRGRRMIGWDEILEGGLAPDATVMSWRGLDGAVAAAALGHDTVLSPEPVLYLDSAQSASPDEPPGRGRIASLRDVYDFDSTPEGITPEREAHIIGVQANVWTEHMRHARRVETMVFPRLIALSEVGWSPQSKRDWSRFSADLPATLKRLDALGVTYNTIPFEPDIAYERAGDTTKLTLINHLSLGEIRYRLNSAAPETYTVPLDVAMPAHITAQTYINGAPLGRERSYAINPDTVATRKSHQLQTCGEPFPHHLEDDAPGEDRAVFAVNVYQSCWLWPQADLSHGLDIRAVVGQVPFNFLTVNGRRKVSFEPPATPYGEMFIRKRIGNAPTCEGEPLATLALPDTIKTNPRLTTVTGAVPAQTGHHDLCIGFTRPSLDPVFVIDQITFRPASDTQP
ncbi:beta-N-acetylhexosaminidase [Asticcacaulis machinosus]|uniref:beta-N-acetylhexosaminidase n=1 Tax=Asticcacaulis machinosus TaxID=2984211 RepID=A0ABT5HE31_9CAUL|nr:family 20 glycosylhydrolase [Asticcacaulis machinosus]